MNLDDARKMVRIAADHGYTEKKDRDELLALLLVQTYELGWAQGRLAREMFGDAKPEPSP